MSKKRPWRSFIWFSSSCAASKASDGREGLHLQVEPESEQGQAGTMPTPGAEGPARPREGRDCARPTGAAPAPTPCGQVLTSSARGPVPAAASFAGRWSWCSCSAAWSAPPASGGTAGGSPGARGEVQAGWAQGLARRQDRLSARDLPSCSPKAHLPTQAGTHKVFLVVAHLPVVPTPPQALCPESGL